MSGVVLLDLVVDAGLAAPAAAALAAVVQAAYDVVGVTANDFVGVTASAYVLVGATLYTMLAALDVADVAAKILVADGKNAALALVAAVVAPTLPAAWE